MQRKCDPRMNILLAEDESTISRLIRQVLTNAGHQVTGVQSAAEAIEAIDDDGFDLVLLDLNLSDGDGFRVVDSIESRIGRHPPVVVMTGERSFADEDPRAARVAGILPKPFALEELEEAVNQFVA